MDYAQQRHNMVESQIRPNQVTDARVIDAARPRAANEEESVAVRTRRGPAPFFLAPASVSRLVPR